MHFQLFSFRYCRSLRYPNSNQLSGTIPTQLGNLTMLTSMYSESHRPPLTLCILSLILFVLIASLSLSLRSHSLNQLNGTIPPQLGNLTMLTSLYSESHRPPLTRVLFLILFVLILSRRSLYSNQLSGTIPPELGNLTMLYSLYA